MKKLVSMLAVMALCLMLLPQAALADDAGTHKHCVCGATHAAVGDHTTAAEQTFTAWTDDDALPSEAGYYYLTKDVTLTDVWCPQDGTVLCLNGHNIIMDKKINIQENCTFTLTDCNSGDAQGKITHAEGEKDRAVYVYEGTFNMYGGVISDNTARDGAVYVFDGIFNMYDGVIADNVSKDNDDNYTGGGGVYVVSGQFNMSGGKITGNTAKEGGGVYLYGGTFNMSGGEITENTAKENGGGVDVFDGTFNMSGGKITGNTAVSSGGAVYIAGNHYHQSNAYFTMSGGEISGNTADYGGGVFLADRSEAKMSGGKITGNTANYGGGVYSSSSPIKVGGTIYVDGNKFKNGFANNISTQKKITVDNELGKLAEGACLSLVYEYAGVKVEGVSQSDANYFKMDDKAYELKWQDDNTLYAKESSSYVVVNGVEVLESNPDVLNDGGSVKYDDDTKTLTLTNASLTKDFSYANNRWVTFVGIYTLMDELNIELVGDNSITLPNRPNDSYSEGIGIYNELNITGNGSLTVQAGNVQEGAVGIKASQLTIGDDVTLKANGGDVCGGTSAYSRGIYVGKLTIGKAKVTATGGDIVALNNGESTGIDLPWGVPMEIADGAEVTATGGDVTVETGEKLTGYNGWAHAESNGISGGNITIGKADVKATSGQAIMLNRLNSESYAESYAVDCYGLKINNGGNLTANCGVATCVDPDDSTKIGKYVEAYSCACYIKGVLDVSGTLIATGGDVVANGGFLPDDELASGGSAQSMAVYVTNGTSSSGGVTVQEGAKVKLLGANATSKSEGIGQVYSYGLYLSYTNFTMNGGTVYVKSGTVTGGEYRGTIAVSVNGYEDNYYGDNGGKFTMNGGWLKAETSNNTALSVALRITLGDDVFINTPANGKISDQTGDGVYIVDGQGYAADTVLLWDGTTAAYTEPGSNNGGGGGGGHSHSKKDNTAKEEEKNETKTDEVTGETENDFIDVKPGDYFADAVKWATENKVTSGSTATTFAPNEVCTRAQIVTFLWRVAGSPVVEADIVFSDVDESAYYAEAIRWAASKGIVDGYGEGIFAPNDTVTREQVAAILFRFAKAEGMDTTQGGMQIREFNDYESISEYAIAAMQWAVNAGIMQGYDNYLTPADECIRAQIVTMLYRLLGK